MKKEVREGYKMTELGEIPEEWKLKNLKSLIQSDKNINYGVLKPGDYTENGVSMIRIVDIKNNKLNVNEVYKISNKLDEQYKKTRLEGNEILMSVVGTIGRVATTNIRHKGMNVHRNISVIPINNNKANKDYVFYSLISSNTQKIIAKKTIGGNQPLLNLEDVRELNIIYPPIWEQEKIASILLIVDEQIDNVDALIEKNKELKKGLMQTLLTKGIGHTKFKKTEIGEIPEAWEIAKLLELSEIKRGASPRPINNPKWFSEEKDVGWIRISDVTKTKKYLTKTEQYLSKEGVAKSRLVKPNDLIMSICATVGKPIILKMNACIHDGFILFDNLNRDKIHTNYLYYLLQNKEEKFKSMGQTGTQANLNTGLVGSMLIAIPDIKEQEKIALIFSEVDKKIEEYEDKKERLEELKKGLMQQLLTGKIRTI